MEEVVPEPVPGTALVENIYLSVDQTLVIGFERLVDAFLGMLRGENIGKMIVEVGESNQRGAY